MFVDEASENQFIKANYVFTSCVKMTSCAVQIVKNKTNDKMNTTRKLEIVKKKNSRTKIHERQLFDQYEGGMLKAQMDEGGCLCTQCRFDHGLVCRTCFCRMGRYRAWKPTS